METTLFFDFITKKHKDPEYSTGLYKPTSVPRCTVRHVVCEYQESLGMSINSPSLLSHVFQRTCRGSSFGELTRFRSHDSDRENYGCTYTSQIKTLHMNYRFRVHFAITLWLSATWWD